MLLKMGLGNIDGVDFLPKTADPMASVSRMSERSMGKDTTIGHWEIAGLISQKPLPTYPDGFPEDIFWRSRDYVKRKQPHGADLYSGRVSLGAVRNFSNILSGRNQGSVECERSTRNG